MKIVVASDNHGSKENLNRIVNIEYNGDYYFHLGDSDLEEKDIKPFISVKGNVDYFNYPKERVIEISNHRFLLLHSNNSYNNDLNLLVNKAKESDCDVVLFGHAHVFYCNTINGVLLVNPGSCLYNRDGTKASYALLHIGNDGYITVERKDI